MDTTADLTHRNILAWDSLYRQTDASVWGTAAIGFLPGVLPDVAAEIPGHLPILDAGAGEGRNVPELQAAGRRVFACDHSHHALAKLAHRFPSTPLAQTDLMNLPFHGGTFGLVLLSDVMETLPAPGPVLGELARVLAPDGVLLCNIPDDDDEIAGIDMSPLAPHEFLYRDRYYFAFHTVNESRQLLTDAGFDVTRTWNCRWEEPPHPRFRPTPHMHRSHVFLARKPAHGEAPRP